MSYAPPPTPEDNQPQYTPYNHPPVPPQAYTPPAYTQPPVYAQQVPVRGGIMQTARLGMIGLIATAVGFVLNLAQFPFAGLFSLAGLVLAIVSLAKKETPKWPAWVTIGLAIAGLLLFAVLLGFLFLWAGTAFVE